MHWQSKRLLGEVLLCHKQVQSKIFCFLGCSGGNYETLYDDDIKPGYNITLEGHAQTADNQTHYFKAFEVTGEAGLKVLNIRDDTDIKYNEMNFLFRDMETITITADTRENMTYHLMVNMCAVDHFQIPV